MCGWISWSHTAFHFLLNASLHHGGCGISMLLSVGHHFFQAFQSHLAAYLPEFLRFCHNVKFCIMRKRFCTAKLSSLSNFMCCCLPLFWPPQNPEYSVGYCLSVWTRSCGTFMEQLFSPELIQHCHNRLML